MHAISLRSSFVLFTVLPALALAQTPVEPGAGPEAPAPSPETKPESMEEPPSLLGGDATTSAIEVIDAAVASDDDALPPPLPPPLSAPLPAVEAPPVLKAAKDETPYSPGIDTRLTFVFADDNLLAGPGRSDEPSPGPQFGADDGNNLFFENYDSKDSGFETLTHLVLFKEAETYFEGLTAAAALVLRLQVDAGSRDGSTSIRDSSSYVQLRYRPTGWDENESISFTGFPVTSDRFRLGFSYRLTWGGRDIFPQAGASVPGVRVQITRDRWYLWLGAKSTVLDEQQRGQAEQATVKVANYGGLVGAGVDLSDELRLEANGGLFTRGVFPSAPLTGEKMYTAGGSLQVTYHHGRDVGASIDLRLYRNDPLSHQIYFQPVKYDDGVDYLIKTEFTMLGTTLEDPDRFGSTLVQFARAGDINFAVRQKSNRYFLDFEVRDLAYILENVPGLVSRQDFTEEQTVHPEWFVAVGYDRYFETYRLTPGVRLGVWRPAFTVTNRVSIGTNPPVSLSGDKTVVVRREGEFDILPDDAGVTPVLAAQLTTRFDISDFMTLLAEVAFELDHNRATFIEDQGGANIAVFVDPAVLSFNMVLQARF